MSIKVRYFASLREKMGRCEENIVLENIETVSDVWKCVSDGEALPDRLLCAINLDYVAPDAKVQDGDEVAFFPPVTGG